MLSVGFVGRGEIERINLEVVSELTIGTATTTTVATAPATTATAGALAGLGVVAALFPVSVVLLGIRLFVIYRLSVRHLNRASG